MDFVSTYYDITKEIEILELRLFDLENELKAARYLCFSGQLPSDPLPVHVPLDKALDQHDNVVAKIKAASELLSQKKLMQQKIEQVARGFQGIEHKVAYMRDIQGKKLKDIAIELDRSEGYIRNISSKISNMTKV